MTELKLELWPNNVLTKKTEKIIVFDDYVSQLVIDMFQLMYNTGGVGISAPQASILQSVLVYKVDNREGFLINPEITSKSEKIIISKEGCLSFPGVYIDIERAAEVAVSYQELDGSQKTLLADNSIACVIQHEIDHLNGVVFTQYLSRLKRDVVNRKMLKFKKYLQRGKDGIKKYGRRQENRLDRVHIHGESV